MSSDNKLGAKRLTFLKTIGGIAIASKIAGVPTTLLDNNKKEVNWEKVEWKNWLKKHLTDRGTLYVKRNGNGARYEKMGKIDLAIKEYEASVNDEVWGSNPYKRLFIIYKKQGNYVDARRVANKWLALANEYKSIIPNKDFKPFEKTGYYKTYQYFEKNLSKI